MNADMIAAARGETPADLLLKNARVVNVFSNEIHPADVAVFKGHVIGFGPYESRETVDLQGRLLCPGFIDAHVHIESSMVTVPEFARAVVPRGVTAVVTDPHEIANVLGLDGVRYMIETSEGLPLRVFVMVPSCVPATDMETSGARLTAEDIQLLFRHKRVIGLAEMMNYPGVIFRAPDVLAKLAAAEGHPIDGHAPGLSGKDLAAYVVSGIGSDHECTTLEEAREKRQMGMHIFIRDGTTARNLDALLPLVTPAAAINCSFCTDDRHPADLLREGSINWLVHRAIQKGMDPVTAVRMGTLHPARYFGLKKLGAVAPGYWADLVVLDDFESFRVAQVYQAGQKVAEGQSLLAPRAKAKAHRLRSSVNVQWHGLDLRVAAPAARPRIRVIGLVPGQIVTKLLEDEATVADGAVVADPARDLLKIAVIERHQASGHVGIGFVRGFGMKSGAIASSVAHDSHNIVVVGATDQDMLAAVKEVARLRGGQAVVNGEQVLASVPLPIAGLMSDLPLEEVRDRIEAMAAAAHGLGCTLPDPVMTMSFLALPVIPELKLTDKGLVDVTKFQPVSLFLE